MKKLNFKIILGILLILITLFGGLFMYFNKAKETKSKEPVSENKVLLFIVTDVSRNCLSNTLYVYNNSEYEVKSPYATPGKDFKIVAKGKYNYDIDIVLEYLNTEITADEHMLNYAVTIEETKKEIYVPFTKENELTKFITSLNEEALFWCE